jgi:cysteine desulfurase
LDIHVHSLGVDLMTVNGGKIYGPPETGFLYVGSNVVLNPQILGGNQQRGIRSGTLSAGLATGLAAALDKAQKMKGKEIERLKGLQKHLVEQLEKKIPEANINGSLKKRLPTNLNISFPGQNNEILIIKLEKLGILTSAGAACAASSNQPSHVLSALGLNKNQIDSSIRISLGRQTSIPDINKLVAALEQIINS